MYNYHRVFMQDCNSVLYNTLMKKYIPLFADRLQFDFPLYSTRPFDFWYTERLFFTIWYNRQQTGTQNNRIYKYKYRRFRSITYTFNLQEHSVYLYILPFKHSVVRGWSGKCMGGGGVMCAIATGGRFFGAFSNNIAPDSCFFFYLWWIEQKSDYIDSLIQS